MPVAWLQEANKSLVTNIEEEEASNKEYNHDIKTYNIISYYRGT